MSSFEAGVPGATWAEVYQWQATRTVVRGFGLRWYTPFNRADPFPMLYVVVSLAVVAAAVCWFCYQLGVQNAQLALRLEKVENALRDTGAPPPPQEAPPEGLKPGSLVRDFELPRVGGGTMTLSQWAGRRVLVAFIHPDCAPSRHFLSKLPPRTSDADPVTLLVSSGSVEKNQRLVADYHVPYPVLLQEDDELSSLYQVHSTPAGYVIDGTGKTEGPLCVAAGGLLGAIGVGPSVATSASSQTTKSIRGSRLLRTGLTAGTTAPDFTLPGLDGSDISLRSLRGSRVLLVFSDPNCGPCQVLAPTLEKVHRRARDLQVVMVSRGDFEANRTKATEQRLTFPIVLQRHWEISKAYGMFATPIAYLIGQNGVLTHDVAVGSDAILRLAEL